MKKEFEGQKKELIQYLTYLKDTLSQVGYTNNDDIVKEIIKTQYNIEEASKAQINSLVEKIDKCLILEEVFNRYPIEEVERYVRRKKLQKINNTK